LPSAQLEQEVPPVDERYFPAGQLVHSEDPATE